ncbi:MAG: AgmX/PglI C-terminal domain-containing protein [Polyangiaceae bacterium]|nr:AgmX/PglI C-terminal domain-containing protein [Polyangiaceae bacterium]
MEGKAKVALTFALYQGEKLIFRQTVAQDIVKVGKDPRSHLRVDDDLASRMHAVIEVVGIVDVTLIDLGNEPGTMVNGQRVNKCKLHPGDQIQIGSTMIVLESAKYATEATEATGAAVVDTPGLAGLPSLVGGGQSTGNEPSAAAGAAGGALGVEAVAANPFASVEPTGGSSSSNPFSPSNPFAPSAFAPNPFVASAADQGYGINAPGGSDFDPNQPYTYAMVKSGPDVRPEDVESLDAAVEVIIKWDTNTIHASHTSPPKSFFVGETDCDYTIPQKVIGTDRAPIVIARGVTVVLIMLPRSTGTIEIPEQGTFTFQEIIASGRARSSSELSGAHEFELPTNAKARMELEEFSIVFEVSAVNAGKHLPVSAFSSIEPAAILFFSLSFLLHVGVLASMAFFMPKMSGDDSEALDRSQILAARKLLDASAEREQEEKQSDQISNENADHREGGTGTRAKGEEGSMGNPNSTATNRRYGIQGPADNADPHIARQAAIRQAQEFGMIGLINAGGGGDPNAPTAPWGREDSLGNDPLSARGNMWGDTIGDAFGAGGLGLSGVGEGGGGRGEGIGMGNIGTFGHGAGTGTGQGFGPGGGGMGGGRGRVTGTHQGKAPRLTPLSTVVNGRLPPEVIQRIVRQNFGRFRLCYENGMRNNPNLEGRIAVRFVIDRSGAVSLTQDGGSSLPDQGVVSCVVRAFQNLSFPQPEGGIVTVIYPIIFSPGD